MAKNWSCGTCGKGFYTEKGMNDHCRMKKHNRGGLKMKKMSTFDYLLWQMHLIEQTSVNPADQFCEDNDEW